MKKKLHLMGVAEIEDHHNLDRMQLTRLLEAGDFPEPVATLFAGRIWEQAEVDEAVRKLRAEGRITADGRIIPRRFLNGAAT